jgi:hypothetical protein
MLSGVRSGMQAETNNESSDYNPRRSISRRRIAIVLSLLFVSLAVLTVRFNSHQISRAELLRHLTEADARPFFKERFHLVGEWKTALQKSGHLRSHRLLERLFPRQLDQVNFEGPVLPVELLERICTVPSLRHLTIIRAPLGDQHLLAISNARQLQGVSFGGPTATRQALQQIAKCNNLTWLDIENGTITDAELSALEKMPQLQHLSLSGNDLRGSGLTHLRRLHQLTSLDLSETLIIDEHLNNISLLTNLLTLELGEHISDTGAGHIVGLTNLTELGLHKSHIDNPGLDLLLKSYPKLRRLTLFHVEARMDRLNLDPYPNVTLDAAF